MKPYDEICEVLVYRHQRARKMLRKEPGLASHWYRAGIRDALKIIDAYRDQMKEELRRAYHAGRNHKKYISIL